MNIIKPLPGTLPMPGRPLADAAGHWPMNSLGDKIIDLSGNGNPGTLQGTAPSWTSGKFGSAILLPGTDEFVNLGAMSILAGVDSLTVSALVYSAVGQGGGNIFTDTRGRWFGRVSMGWHSGFDWMLFRVHNSEGTTDSVTALGLAANTWYHFVGVWDGATIRIYVNGVLQPDIGILTGVTHSASYGACIGCGYYNDVYSGFWNGLIARVMVLRRGLTASEVASLYRELFCMFPEQIMPEFGIAA